MVVVRMAPEAGRDASPLVLFDVGGMLWDVSNLEQILALDMVEVPG